MKLVSYQHEGIDRLGLLVEDLVYNLNELDSDIPDNMLEFLWEWDEVFPKARALETKIKNREISANAGILLTGLELLAPVPHPSSCRDAYAFRQHVEAARRNRGVEMIPEFDLFPVFYFTNHNAIQGPGPVYCMPDHLIKLDFELEIAAVICRPGRNIRAEEADNYIGGYMIMNDFSARELQMQEMKLNLGPAKGKDFATAVGPWLVTPDELEPYKTNPKPGHTGTLYNLEMIARVNGKEVSRGNMNSMDWTFAEIIERCSYGVEMLPGDIIGSGTVGTGCFLELNGTGKRLDPNYKPQWLQDGDEIELEITGLGTLYNVIEKIDTDYSILSRIKNLQKS